MIIHWDPNPDLFVIPVLNWPIKWYGLFFALGFAIGFPIFEGILFRYFKQKADPFPPDVLKKSVLDITDKITMTMVIATIVGARLGHLVFYERPSDYLSDPLEIFKVWNGGLASHGAAIAIILALGFFSRWSKKIDPGLTWIRLLDFVCVPTALVGFLIRLGNFFNQEILGRPTDLPWGVIFGHPADRSALVARHPVQLYEAFFYLAVFAIIWRLTFKRFFLIQQGKLIGLFLMLVFGFRFFIEFLKMEQSRWYMAPHWLTMGQWLSLPLVGFGLLFFFLPGLTKRSARNF